jgi:hypothetical protein
MTSGFMTSGTAKAGYGWRRAVTGAATTGAVTAGLILGFGAATAHADVLDDLAAQYTTAAGAGEVANWLHTSLALRAAGFKPTAGELQLIQDSLQYKPNQIPLVNALQATVATQQKLQQRANAAAGGGNPVTIGVNQYDPSNPTQLGGFTVGSGPGANGTGPGGGNSINFGGQGTVLGAAPDG